MIRLNGTVVRVDPRLLRACPALLSVQKIPGPPETACLVLAYLGGSAVCLRDNQILDVLDASIRLGIQELAEQCQDMLILRLSGASARFLFLRADALGAEKLRREAEALLL